MINPQDVFPQALYDIYDGRYGQLTDVIATKLGQQSGFIAYDTKAHLDADLNHPVNTPAVVMLDANNSNNCYYLKVGASGTGSWTKSGLPFSWMYQVSWFASLNAAIAAMGSTPGILLLNAPSTLSSSIVAPETLQIVATRKGLVTINSLQTLTINGSFEAGCSQVFTGAGAVAGLPEIGHTS